MSYSDLKSDFVAVARHVDSSTVMLSTLCQFFREYKRLNDNYSHALAALQKRLSTQLQTQTTGLTTLRTALDSFETFIEDQVKNFSYLSQNTQIELIEPLELFNDNFVSSSAPGIKTGSKEEKKIQKLREQVLKAKAKYMNSCIQSEQAEANIAKSFEQDLDSEEKLQKLTRSACDIRSQVEVDSVKYKVSLSGIQDKKTDSYRVIVPILETLQQNQESCIHFVKYSLEKFVKHQQKCSQNTIADIGELGELLHDVNSVIDISSYVETHRDPLAEKEDEFISYEEWKQIKPEEVCDDDFEVLEVEEQEVDHDKMLIKEILNLIVPKNRGQAGPVEETLMASVIDLLQCPDGRHLFYRKLSRRRHWNRLSQPSLDVLANLFNSFLSAMVNEDDKNPDLFYKILAISQHFFCAVSSKRQYLNSYLLQHPIMTDRFRWLEAINYAIDLRMDEDREIAKMKRSNKKKGIFGQIKNFAGKFQFKAKDDQPLKSQTFMVLSEFNFYMINLGLPLEEASEIVLSICHRVELDTDRVCVLLAELQANQRSTRVNRVDVVRQSLKKREKERQTWGSILPYGLCLEFLTEQDLLSLLWVCKKFKNTMFFKVLKIRLERLGPENPRENMIRSFAWKSILFPENFNVNYESLLNKINTDTQVNFFDEVIRLDVLRSFRNNPNISDANLSNVLRVYAFYNPDVGYCQGMNYVVGTLFLQLQSESDTFVALVGLVEKFRMTSLFYKELPKLKLFFYQLDRIIGILLPEVHEHFKEEMINSAHYASPWFITIFSSILQNSPLLFQLWDSFLLEGWKIVFKTSIAILSEMGELLISSPFENIVQLLNNLCAPTCPIQMFDCNFMSKVRSVHISDSLLRDLESEFEHLKIRATVNPKKPKNKSSLN